MTFEDYKKIYSNASPKVLVTRMIEESDLISTSLASKFDAMYRGDKCSEGYWSRELEAHRERQRWIADQILEAIKGKMPRVLTLEEACDAPCIWLEARSGALLDIFRIRRVPIDSTAIMIYRMFGGDGISLSDGYFEKHFRCWSDKPTQEQMEAIPWGT